MKIVETSTREEWLEARRGYLTATDLAKIMTGGPAAWAEVKNSKEAPKRSLDGVKAIDYGHEREPEIAAFLQVFEDDRLVPNGKLCVSDADPRVAATPDMLGIVDGRCVVIGEIKTTNKDWDEIPRNYWVQVQVQLWVTGAEKCIFGWEVHQNYVPGEIKAIEVLPDREFFAEIEATKKRFLDEDVAPDPWEVLLDEYIVAKTLAEHAETQLADVKARMQKFAGDKDITYKSGLGSVSWKFGTSNRLQEKKLLADHPELAEKYFKFDAAAFKRAEKELAEAYTVKSTNKSRSLRVTLPKKEEEK
ncbi:hypothetical protein FRC0485_01514 [Corynebacterium diphtheriae]|nr:hypothetical protein FRC0485_01514 [Corynebacterium diphtheriae]